MDRTVPTGSSPSEPGPQDHGHGATHSSIARPLAKPRRAACQSCRKRKVRCDNVRPTCGFCRHNGMDCVYIERGDYAEENRELRKVIERLDTLTHTMDNIQSLLFSSGTPVSSGHPPPPQQAERPREFPMEDAEPYKDYLQIPSCRGSADTVLTWPVFRGRFRESALITTLFQSSHDAENAAIETWVVPDGFHPTNEERIPALVDQFIQNVHTKNPILNLEALIRSGRQAAEFGLGWDAQSCLVALACALGCISQPFTASIKMPLQETSLLRSTSAVGLKEGETFFVMACRRIGLLRYSVLGAQCHFFAGVYLMYTFRPLAAWNHFYQASTFYRLRLRMLDGLGIDDDLSPEELAQQGTSVSRHLEQSLYWSCFKSEVEIRVELPLPQSAIAEYEYPALFPTPPNLSDDYPEGSSQGTGWPAPWNASRLADAPQVNQAQKSFEVRNHIMQLFDEDQSWYYYLTEVALRRIGNRVLNAFYSKGPGMWSSIKPLIPLALEFESQINAWSANLPPAMRYYEDNAGPGQTRNTFPESQDSITLELSWAIANRLLEIRLWLYQPFLYFGIHHPIGPGNRAGRDPGSSFTNDELATISALVKSGLDSTVKILEARCLRHRHHGIWFDLRALVTSSLIVIAAMRSGNLDVPGLDRRVGLKGHFHGTLEALRYWEDEAPDIKKARRLLDDLLMEAR